MCIRDSGVNVVMPDTSYLQANLNRFRGMIVTPFKENGEVDYELAIKLSNYLCENGSDGIVLCGTTGESPLLHGLNNIICLLQ